MYLGAAAGVGTTYAMLDEGERRSGRGTHVRVGWVDTHDRPRTADKLRSLTHGAPVPTFLDVEDILREQPTVVLVDDLHRATGPSQRPHWQEVDRLLDAGIHVVATLTVQHIASLADTVATIVGSEPAETVPDSFLARAEQVELVDMTPEAIRRRIAHGNVFSPQGLAPDESELFNSEAFGRLRSLLIAWMADRLAPTAEGPGDIREKVVVAISDAESSATVVRRAARLAQRSHADLLGVHVLGNGSLSGRSARRNQIESLGGSYHEIEGDDAADALVSFAEAEHATQLVIGSSLGAHRWRTRHSVVQRVLGRTAALDVHVVHTGTPALHRQLRRRSSISLARQLLGLMLGVVVITLLTVLLVANRGELSVATSLALYLLAVVAVTAVGGQWPGVVAAIASPLVANWYLIAPYHTLRINEAENLIELLVFISVSLIVSAFVSVAARRTHEADRAWREASSLAKLTETGASETLQGVVDLLCSTFALDGVAILRTTEQIVEVVAVAGGNPPRSTADADSSTPLDSRTVVALRGRPLTADDHRVLRAFLVQISKAIERRRLREVELEAESLAQADQLRTAILRAVSHDLRSPLASIKASVSSLRQGDVQWPEDLRVEFLSSIESETDRLTSIVTNLLDLSRIEAGALQPNLRAVSLEEVIPSALVSLGDRGGAVQIAAMGQAEVLADPALLERALANLLDNALKWSPHGKPVTVRSHVRGADVQIHVIDHGPGIPPDQRGVVTQPFHRLVDSGAGGLGLGLAIAERVIVAMHGRLDLRDTPGGGLTAVISLPNAEWAEG